MHPRMIERYRRYRAQGTPAGRALRWARCSPTPNLFGGDDRATWESEGFILKARLVVDNNGNPSYLGRFSHRREEGALPLNRHDCSAGWFVPENTERDHYESLRRMKYGRAEAGRLARRFARDDLQRFGEFGDRWWLVGCTVTAFREGIELGSAALWGIESDSGDGYFNQIAHELADEAISEARTHLNRLCLRGGA